MAVGLVAIAALVAAILYLRSSARPPAVISSLQITNDGTSKRSLVTDGTRLYFSEHLNGHSVLMQVSTAGGDTAPVPTSLPSADIYDFYPGRSELLVEGCSRGFGDRVAGLGTASSCRIASACGKHTRARGHVDARWSTHRVCEAIQLYICAMRMEAIRASSSPCREFLLRFGFLPMAAACALPSATPTSALLPCGRFQPTGKICIRSCRTGTNRRRNLAEPGRPHGDYFLFESTRDHSSEHLGAARG